MRSSRATAVRSWPSASREACPSPRFHAAPRCSWGGLVRSEDGQFDFQDIVSLRTIADLVQRGVAPGAIRASIRGLSRVLPGTERPLAQLSIVADDAGRLLARFEESLIGPDGQMVLDFSSRPDDAVAEPPPALDASFGADAEEWLARGVALEEQERLEDAADAYRQALAARPRYPEAQFNLANTLRDLGRCDEARQLYRAAADLEPAMAEVWYNLADLLEEEGQFEKAAGCLEQALSADPVYADAHYNLACLLEKMDRAADAARHWRRYVGLDPDSEWADEARRRLDSYGATSRHGDEKSKVEGPESKVQSPKSKVESGTVDAPPRRPESGSFDFRPSDLRAKPTLGYSKSGSQVKKKDRFL
ncbi:MAG: hypothetical protein CMJ18_09640 [Phycisphaeraceae bacterium]|nr:hypothetical protein [Phycisphaeraceae bacterium]